MTKYQQWGRKKKKKNKNKKKKATQLNKFPNYHSQIHNDEAYVLSVVRAYTSNKKSNKTKIAPNPNGILNLVTKLLVPNCIRN